MTIALATAPVPPTSAFPDETACRRVNSRVIFHPTNGPDTLPCTQTAGVLVFTYADSLDEVIRVSVDLDTVDPRFVGPDGTVPLKITVQGNVVFDDDRRRSPRDPDVGDVLGALLDAVPDHEESVIRSAARSAGLLRRCPVCGWDTPTWGASPSVRCEGPGPCNEPLPTGPGHGGEMAEEQAGQERARLIADGEESGALKVAEPCEQP